MNSVSLRQLPVPEADRIVLMSNQYPKAGVPQNDTSAIGDYYDRIKEVPAPRAVQVKRQIDLVLHWEGF